MQPTSLSRASFGAAVAALREQRGLSAAALASATQLHPTLIQLIERGLTGVRLPTIISLADALGLSAGELLRVAERSDGAS